MKVSLQSKIYLNLLTVVWSLTVRWLDWSPATTRWRPTTTTTRSSTTIETNLSMKTSLNRFFLIYYNVCFIPLKLNFLHDDEWFHLHRFSLGHIVHTRGFVSAVHLHSLKLYFGDFGFKVHSFWLYIAQALKFQACTHLVRILWRGWIFLCACF